MSREKKTIEKLTHILTKTGAKAATCTENGNTEYWTCETCHKLFSDAEGKNEITKADIVVKALGHNWSEWTVTTPATEKKEGVETRTCSRCDQKETRSIPKLSHTHSLTMTEAKPATCTDNGNTAYWTCSGCGKFFSDAKGKNEITKDSWVIKAFDHTPGAAVKENEVPATETSPGSYDEVVYCSVCGEELSRKNIEIPMLTHDPVITFLANGGEGKMEAQTVTAGKETALTANSFTCGDRAFTGWNTKADGLGVAYADKQAVILSGDLTLYAIWETEDIATQILDVAIEGSSGAKTIPVGSFTLDVSVQLDEATKPDTVQVLVASYTEAGQFLSYSSGTLTRDSDGIYTASVAIQNNGDTDYLHIMMLSQDGWIPLAEAMEMR